MKRFWVLGALSATVLCAQSNVRVFSAELSAPFGAVPGKVVVHDAMLTFVDSEKPESSFTVDKANVQSITRVNDSLVVQLKKAVKDRVGESNRLSLRLSVPSESTVVEQWLEKGVATAAPAAAAADDAATGGERWSYPARRSKRIGGTDGTLIITPGRVIFESLDKVEDTRRWEMQEIKELKRKNPYQLEIIPFRGEKYSLKLSGSGMETQQYRELVDRITKARSARP
ncbi:MAG: hypothetical protein IT164_02870 [Bryobacterales bacterium]|nr:hypothetical protein [Bryobacterales bacterium]